MNSRHFFSIFAVTLGLSFVGSSLAQQTRLEEKGETRSTDKTDQANSKEGKLHPASQCIGSTLYNAKEESLGSINEVVLNREGMLKYAIVKHDATLGVGGTYIAVPWHSMKFDKANDRVMINMEKGRFGQAPAITTDNYLELTNAAWREKVNAHFKAADHKKGKTDQAREEAREGDADKRDVAAKDSSANDLFRSSQIIGANVVGKDTKEIAQVNDLMVGDKECVKFAILGHGGFLDIGESNIAVPWKALDLSRDAQKEGLRLALDKSADDLKNAPLVKTDGYGELANDQFVQTVNQYFGVEQTEVETEAPIKKDLPDDSATPDKPKND